MALKKIVFVIVEGPSENDALGLFLRKMFNQEEVMIYIMKGDITVKSGAKQTIRDDVIGFMNNNYLELEDFKEIIHIVDTDGAFLDDKLIFEDKNIKHIQYCRNRIKAREKENIIIRNRLKRTNLLKLYKCGKIAGIPYRTFYMSCNLDHVLYNKANNKDRNKVDDAHKIAKLYLGKEEEFKEFLLQPKISTAKEGYEGSWKYISEGTHSVERHTNIGICFDRVEDNK